MRQLNTAKQVLGRHPKIHAILILFGGLAWTLAALWEGGWIAKPLWISTSSVSFIGLLLLLSHTFLRLDTVPALPKSTENGAPVDSERGEYSQVRLLALTAAVFLTVGLLFVALVADLLLKPPVLMFGSVLAVGIFVLFLLVPGKKSPRYILLALGLGLISILPLWGIPSNYNEPTGHMSYVKLCSGLLILTLAIWDMVTMRSKPLEA